MSLRDIGCLLLLASAALAQSDRGTITGTVSDPAGASVAGAIIEARNTETSVVYPVASSETGNYTLSQLPVGSYELTVNVPGFKRYLRQNLLVETAQTMRIDVLLEVGSQTEVVTVTEQASLLKTESGEVSTTIQAQRMIDLGGLGIGGTFATSQGLRTYLSEIQLVPGASNPASGFILGVRVNGSPNGTQRSVIDGADSTNQINAVQAGTGASMDAIQETAIQTSNFAAEFGQVGGGLFNMTMRSGTNQYHGAGYDYLVNEAFNASTPFTNVLPRTRRNDYGFNIGGPVRIPKVYNGKDKTFFFYNREQYREFFVVNDTAITVPTALYRQGIFTQALTGRNLGTDPLGRVIAEGMIYDPKSTRTVGGVPVRDPFSNNTIAPTSFDKVAAAIQSLIPNPTNPTATALNYLPSFPNDRITTNESVKIDHQINSRIRISGTWLTNATATQYSQSLNASEGLPPTITQTRGSFSRSMNWRFNFDDTISPTMLWHISIGSLQYLLDDHSPTTNFDQSAIGLVGTPNPGKRFPSISGLCFSGVAPACTGTGGMANMGPGVGAAQSLTKQFTPTYATSLTWVKGNHTYKFGGELRTFGYPLHNLTATNGSFVFSSNQTAQLSNCPTPATCTALQSATLGVGTMGFPYASFLLGLVNNGVVNPPADLKT
ncbi:MAG TPA: carboxypeptidase-like regulatory domain-containing protein, partial [Bryobacteraceae bacterium]|nr:carboxypeptidase-like regulatory domain-containing protein [Bryobacteraceae bacterium]